MKRILSLILTVALLLTGFSCRSSVPEKTYHTDLSFSGLSDSGTDAALEIARAKELQFRIARGELAGTRAQEALETRANALNRLRTDEAIAYVRYCLDVTNVENRRKYDTLTVQLQTLACILTDISLMLAKDPELKDVYDGETLEALLRADALSDPAVLPLLERERALEGDYEALPGKLTVNLNGREWTGDEILSDPTLSIDDFTYLYESYSKLFNAEAGAIFLELIAVRNEIAVTLGFDSYADFMYACYNRDYTPQDAAQLSERVKVAIVPLFSEMRSDFFSAGAQLYGMVFEEEPTMERIGSVVAEILQELSEPWEYMLAHSMYDLGTNETRMPGSFTTYFEDYGAPFLFSSWTNGFEMPSTVIHEFGHYASFYLNAGAVYGANSLDLAEIDAQGLELLSVLRYDTLYNDLSGAAETAQIFYALYTLIDGCMEDAFQQFAYGQETPTIEALNAEYGRLAEAYGLDLLGADARSWTQIAHTFQSPFYYISYAAGMTAALELYLSARRDPNAAGKAYRAVLMRERGARFSETLHAAGLSDPFATETIKKLAIELGSDRRNRKNE